MECGFIGDLQGYLIQPPLRGSPLGFLLVAPRRRTAIVYQFHVFAIAHTGPLSRSGAGSGVANARLVRGRW